MQLLNQQLHEQFNFTQGDTVVLHLLAVDDDGVPVNLTGAVLTTQIQGANIVGPVTFPNGQHTLGDQNAAPGTFTLALSPSNTGDCGEGQGKQIVTQAAIAGAVTYFHGNNLLTVLVPEPLQ